MGYEGMFYQGLLSTLQDYVKDFHSSCQLTNLKVEWIYTMLLTPTPKRSTELRRTVLSLVVAVLSQFLSFFF